MLRLLLDQILELYDGGKNTSTRRKRNHTCRSRTRKCAKHFVICACTFTHAHALLPPLNTHFMSVLVRIMDVLSTWVCLRCRRIRLQRFLKQSFSLLTTREHIKAHASVHQRACQGVGAYKRQDEIDQSTRASADT